MIRCMPNNYKTMGRKRPLREQLICMHSLHIGIGTSGVQERDTDMVYRIFVEKKPALANEARSLQNELQSLLGIKELTSVRIINRYDVENIEKPLFDYAKSTVFSEPQLDITYDELEPVKGEIMFAVEYLPGQFDQRADSAAQCIQLISHGERPLVNTARVYILKGKISKEQLLAIKKYVINPVESREASLDKPATLSVSYHIPKTVETLTGFTKLDEKGLAALIRELGLAMDQDDIRFSQQYFIKENRDPTITEIRMIDTYWSDHCRHTTFLTTIDKVTTESPLLQKAYDEYLAVRKAVGRDKPVNLMDIATIAVRYLKQAGKLEKLDESPEINACTVKITVNVDGQDEDWLLLFKNETHNHPTEIEPFGGAATCLGGGDPRSPFGPGLRVFGDAADGSRKPPDSRERDAGWKTSAAKDRLDGGGGLQFVRKPDRACDRHCR